MALTLDEITELFHANGAVQYGAEAVTQQQHALQCAHLAEQADACPALIAAALLHDLGHLLALEQRPKSVGADDLHQFMALPFLRGVFPDAVLAPIRMHVDAKRYLCRVDPSYWAGLSPASKRSLVLQGGPFSGDEAHAFMVQAFAADAVALRRWDDCAKNPETSTPGWTHYAGVLERVSCVSPAPAR
ncbi:MAG: phosphohydrolase [Polaromonas sp.]|uniref:phosphonate degradation HD-domain oxygenase n=1 Tax=Polaromonas sp. TaxID=1869339 RepID=UPI002736419E|nr:phosphonate degradation HD-domain oxygenase [Polaromonas sp.]MDP2817829.1 phosphohydrolase [Polaromonas sp.]